MRLSPPLAITGIIAASFAWMAWEYEPTQRNELTYTEFQCVARCGLSFITQNRPSTGFVKTEAASPLCATSQITALPNNHADTPCDLMAETAR